MIGGAINRLSPQVPAEAVQAGEANLVTHAQTLTHTQLQVLANHLVEVVDPDAADQTLAEQLEADEARALQQTSFRGRKGADGIARYCGKMPNLQYDMLTTALEALASPRRASLQVAEGATAETDPTQHTY